MNKEVVIIHYFGGKFRISDEIVAFLEANRKPNQGFFEPFVGGLNITTKMSGSRTASDINEYLICLYQALQQGYELPDHCTKEQYDYIRAHQDEDKALAGFIGIACSFAGKWWGGYARDSRLTDKGRDHCEVGKRSILKKMETCQDVEFMSGSYDEFIPHDMLIYCDPPYQGTTSYAFDFDHRKFWATMRRWSRNNDVYISEFEAPDDFKVVWEKEGRVETRDKDNQRKKKIERIFKYKEGK